MTEQEMAKVLAQAAAFDNRTPDAVVLTVWLKAIGDLHYPDAMQAVIDHYAESTEWLKPGHIRARVKKIRAERLRNADTLRPAIDPDARDYGPQLRRLIAGIADGRTVAAAIGPGTDTRRGTEPPAAYVAARGPDYARRRAALSVPCPLPECGQDTGKPCRVPGTRRDLTAGYHPARLDTAREHLNA